MSGKTHAICSAAITTVGVMATGFSTTCFDMKVNPFLVIAITSVTAYLPDVDSGGSKLGSMFPIISKNLKHRGWLTHSLVIPILLWVCLVFRISDIVGYVCFGLVLFLFSMYFKNIMLLVVLAGVSIYTFMKEGYATFIIGVCLGMSLHVIEDLFGKLGCPIFFPLSKKRIHFNLVVTGKKSESVFTFIWLGGCLACSIFTPAGAYIMGVFTTLINTIG